MMKKLITLLMLVSIISITLIGCSSNNENNNNENNTSGVGNKAEIALVTATGSIDDKSFNQGAWEGLKKYADQHNIGYKYYKPNDQSVSALESAIDLAVMGGAKIVICPGYLFEVPLYTMQTKYKDVTFLILDGAPVDENGTQKIESNVASYSYAEEQAGFLAGYGAVKDGYRNLGFMGGIAVPAVVRYGYGFVEGAEYAAKELNLAKDEVKVNYTYVGNFDATPDNKVKASSWFANGTEVIFACGGSVGNSVMSAAESAGAKVIGVDIDQASESTTVITSAMKNVSKTVFDALSQYYSNSLVTGTATKLDVTTDSVLLPLDTSKFNVFDKEQYDAIYEQLSSGTVVIKTDQDVTKVGELPLEYVAVTEIK